MGNYLSRTYNKQESAFIDKNLKEGKGFYGCKVCGKRYNIGRIKRGNASMMLAKMEGHIVKHLK